MTTSLSTTETTRLAELLTIIQNGVRDVGEALIEIRDKKLYRAESKSFEEFCAKNLHMGRAHAYRLIEYHEMKMSPIGDKIANEGQAREVARVKPEKRARVVREAAARAEEEGKPMAARHIAAAAREEEPELEEKPHVVIHTDEEALGNLKAAGVIRSFKAWLDMNFPDKSERKWTLNLLHDHIEDLLTKLSQSGEVR